MGQPGLFFVLSLKNGPAPASFCLFLFLWSNIRTTKIVDISRIGTRIVGVEGELTDHSAHNHDPFVFVLDNNNFTAKIEDFSGIWTHTVVVKGNYRYQKVGLQYWSIWAFKEYKTK